MNRNYCFCGLAIGKRYREFAMHLAADLDRHHPGIKYVLLTDNVNDFKDLSNVTPISHIQESALFAYQDRRFALQEALSRFDIAIQIDTDTKINRPLILPGELFALNGILARTENLDEHLRKYQPGNLKIYEDIAHKLGICVNDVLYVGEFIFCMARDGKEKDFFMYWGKIARYLDLHRVCGADGPTIGLAAKKAGLTVTHSDWPSTVEHEFVVHYKNMSGRNASSAPFLERLTLRLGYHYRLNKTRLLSLKDFKLYHYK
jgi:hypothetical protein